MCPAKMTNIARELCGPFGCLCRVWSFVIPLAGTRLMVTGPGPGRNPATPGSAGGRGAGMPLRTYHGPLAPGACRPQRFGGPEGKRCACVIIYTNAGATFYAHNHHHPGPKSQVNTRDAHVHRPTPTPCAVRLLWGCGSRMPLAGHRVAAVRNRFPYHSSLASLSSSLSSSSLTFNARQA